MILPKKLAEDDTIGLFSPSYPASVRWVNGSSPSVRFLQEKGFHIQYGSLTGKRDFYRSGSIHDRAAELNELIYSKEVQCIMAVSGGFVSNSILPYIDYDYLKENPKVIIGFSDVTAILLAIYAKTGMTTYYGPVLSCFDRKPPISLYTYDYMNDIIGSVKKPPHRLPVPELWTEDYIDFDEDISYTTTPNKLVTLNGGTAEGRLLVCNLNTLLGFMASDYMPGIQPGDILLIEDKHLDAQTVERSFSMLKLCGVFDKIGGLIIGKHIDFIDCGTNRRHYEILQEVMGSVAFPVLAEFDCSHAMPMLTLPIGITARLDATEQTLTLMEKWIEE